ncbi:MAG TPA: N-acetyltransferase, partial [Acidimicrobiales bacterium]|nr:N-acetyltransferase [Acidimicrobiales bacterium]
GEVHLDAFAPDDRPKLLVELVVASPRHVPGLSLVAEVDGAIVGHVLFSHVDLVGDDGVSREVLTLSPLGVRTSWQRRGVGGALVREGLVRAEAAGEALVTVEGHPGYYPRFGFELASALGVVMRLPAWAPREAAMALALPACTPAHTGRIAYPSAFDVVAED